MFIQSRSEDLIEEVRTEYQNYRKEQEMQKHALENEADEATMEGSRHSLRFGQLLMSIENLFLRCTMKRKQIKHVTTLQDLEDGKEEEEADPDSLKAKQKHSIFQLRVILA